MHLPKYTLGFEALVGDRRFSGAAKKELSNARTTSPKEGRQHQIGDDSHRHEEYSEQVVVGPVVSPRHHTLLLKVVKQGEKILGKIGAV